MRVLISSILAAVALLGCGAREPVRDVPNVIRGPGGGPAVSIDLRLEKVDGTEIDLVQYRGRTVLVTYFATWCVPCIDGLPGLNDLIDGPLAVDDFNILAVSVDLEPRKILPHFLNFMPLLFPVVLADEGTLRGDSPFGQLKGVPVSFLVDPGGRHVETFVGLVPIEHLRARVRTLNGVDR